jgi:transposase InsO family protein
VKRKRFSVEQIVAVLKQAEVGVPVPELIRQVGISEQTLYRWKKLVYRLYREEGLTLRHKPRRKRRAALHRHERFRPTGANQVWSLDFVADQLSDGRRFRALTILDVFTRESLAIEVGQRLKGEDVVAALNQICGRRGVPKILFCDNGSEFTSQIMDLWAFTTACRSTSRGRGSQPITRT